MRLIDTIKEIPERVEQLVGNFDCLAQEIVQYIRQFSFYPDEIVFVASGSSYNAAFAVKHFAEKSLGIRITLSYPNDFLYQRTILNDKALYVFISQTGRTAAVEECIRFVLSKELMNLSMTADDTSRIAKLADFHFNIGCGEEQYLFRTKGYTCTVVSCILLCMAVAKAAGLRAEKELCQYLADLKALPRSLSGIICAAENWAAKNIAVIDKKKCLIVSGEGDLWPIAQEAAIKFMEMLPIMSDSYEIEELIHGPQNAFHSEILFIFLYNKDCDSLRALKIHEFIKNEIGDSILISNEKGADMDLPLQLESRYFYFLELATACQVLAYYFSDFKGRDLSKRIHSQIDNYIQKQL